MSWNLNIWIFVSETGKNWALGANKTQQCDNTFAKYAPASKAVDGNTDGIFAHHSCSKTKYSKILRGTWWRVVTKELILIDGVVITNRADCCGELYDKNYCYIFSTFCKSCLHISYDNYSEKIALPNSWIIVLTCCRLGDEPFDCSSRPMSGTLQDVQHSLKRTCHRRNRIHWM